MSPRTWWFRREGLLGMKCAGDGRGTRPGRGVVGDRRKSESRDELGGMVVVVAFYRYSMI